MDTSIFREYDIRGIWPTQINEDISHILGKSFASYIKNKDVIVGYDNRLSSPIIHENLVKGLYECGANITDLGLCTTPMYYALKKHLKIENGIMITASHNPKEYNGFKISFDLKGNAFGKMIENFRDFTLKNEFTFKEGNYYKFKNTKEIYLNYIKNGINLGPRKVKAVFDTGNGTGSIIIKDILNLFDLDYKLINEISDGNFPNHHPDPCEPKNMIELGNCVKDNNYDIGIGIDGDADRVGITDENGNLIPIDKVMIIIYKYLNEHLQKRQAIMDVKCSKALIDEMQNINIPIEVYRTGNSYMNNRINELGLDFGGEFSGHLWFLDKWPGFDDGIYNALRIIEILSKTDIILSKEIEKMPKYFNTPEIKIPTDDNIKDKVIEKVKEYCKENNIKYNDIDGVRIDYDDGFTLIRKSNTGPNLTVRFEKQNETSLENEKNKYIDLIQKIKDSL